MAATESLIAASTVSEADLARAEKFAREPFVHEGEDAAAVLAFAPAEAAAVLRTLIPPGVRLLAQRGDDLGARLTHVFDDLLAQHAAVLVLDADSPTLPMTWVADWPAFSRSSNGLNLAKITPALLALVKVAPEKPAKATA